ncbi:MAG: hypothetical protein IT534_02110 [Bauldia sp.]|nr:hypothetical protein [Bauldia sp.]
MAAIEWPASSAPGAHPGENAGRLVNAFAEPLGDGARGAVVLRRVPGLAAAAASSFFGCRALHLVGDTLLAGFSGRVARVDLAAGTITSLGTLGGQDRFTIAHNNAATPDIVAVAEAGAFTLSTSGAPVPFADADLPASPGPISVCFQAGYFFFGYGDGRIFASGLNTTSVNALDFTTAQTRPGGVTRLVPWNGDLLAFGPAAIDVYRNAGNATGFPYAHGDTIGKGIFGRFAVAGFEDGFVNRLIFVGDDRIVYRLDGYSPVAISTPDVVRSLESVADGEDVDALVYMNGPHAVFAVSGADFTWEYNLGTAAWNERRSHGMRRWRATQSVRAGGRWIAGAIDSGRLFAITRDAPTEDGAPLVFEAWSKPMAAFPARIAFPRADFDFVVGVGSAAAEPPIATAPTVALSWSDDGGGAWSTPLLRSLGGEGERRTRISLARTGLSGAIGRQWKAVIADPVPVGLIGGAAAAQPREA